MQSLLIISWVTFDNLKCLYLLEFSDIVLQTCYKRTASHYSSPHLNSALYYIVFFSVIILKPIRQIVIYSTSSFSIAITVMLTIPVLSVCSLTLKSDQNFIGQGSDLTTGRSLFHTGIFNANLVGASFVIKSNDI